MKKVKIILEMIKFEHTVFALPFAFLGAVLGSLMVEGTWPAIGEWVWITLAMVGARSAAMTMNRVIDARIDKRNPRTAGRAIPAGLISMNQSILFIAVSLLVLVTAAFQLNMLSVYLLPAAVFFLTFYSYTKRFTWLCHIFLGVTIAIAPLGGWVGATGTLRPEALLLFLAVAFWIAGFDVIYATQDKEHDDEEGIHSIPSRFGVPKALMAARLFHCISFLALLSLHFLSPLSWVYLAGVLIAGVVMTYEHSIVKPNDLSRVGVAFFPMNGVISFVMLFFTIGDMLL
ncbi:UbiA-like polyprenyltransferase [Salibacterium qingdaonense]|uniref:4-hydroxybenzoate polyprenyltransferase n=1 Tax=Salibacterium qingdaonense TaxID=266892 RepID=A0A1I4M4N0_9BACI|nr:UbiA-like polyprenyltransferase [Salibacterium qingdaonense]SFL97985.1 4-hydroxybenzoate polyprenyltransferase [Salibacterium qingdaonense]